MIKVFNKKNTIIKAEPLEGDSSEWFLQFPELFPRTVNNPSPVERPSVLRVFDRPTVVDGYLQILRQIFAFLSTSMNSWQNAKIDLVGMQNLFC